MSRPVCVQHQMEMRADKNNVVVCIHASFGPYQIFYADRWICRVGGEQIITGWGSGPISEHFMDDFADWLEKVDHHVYERASAVPS